jgi:hypothetical protein
VPSIVGLRQRFPQRFQGFLQPAVRLLKELCGRHQVFRWLLHPPRPTSKLRSLSGSLIACLRKRLQ